MSSRIPIDISDNQSMQRVRIHCRVPCLSSTLPYMKRPKTGGGWHAIAYTWRTARKVGGLWKLYRALRSRNACKTCALGMGGQRGGMVNEAGRFPEVCKKSMQAMAADMQGKIVPEFFAQYSIDQLRQMSPRELESMGRLADPIYAGPNDTHYRPISWDEALDFCVRRLGDVTPDENFFYFSGRASNEAAFLWQLFARLYGTNNVNNCSYYCHQASGVGLKSSIGVGTGTIVLEDVEGCDLFFLIGGNPASNHPRLMTLLADIRQRGGHIVVINPIREMGLMNFSIPSKPWSLLFGSKIATHYLQPHIGGDIALLVGIAKRTLEMGAIDGVFLSHHTSEYDAVEKSLKETSWESIESASGVSQKEINTIAELYAKSNATIFAWTMGITHHLHGVDNVRAIVNLALMRGMVGRRDAGLLPIRGHSNVQGIGSVGVTPQLAAPVLERLQSHFGVTLPTTPGLDTLACIDAMRDGRLKNAWCLGGNLFGSNPDAEKTAAAFKKLSSVVYLSTTLNTGHAWGRGRETLILPVKARDEEAQATTQESMFNYVRMSDGGPARLPGPRSEVEIVTQLASRILGDSGPINWREMSDHRNIRQSIASIIPGYEKIGEIDNTRKEFQIEGRTFHEPRFKTPTGKALFHVTPIPEFETPPNTLRLMTIRSEGQFNTVVYEEEDWYRGQQRRDVILMNGEDIARLGLREDQPVTVRSSCGEMHNILVRAIDIRSGSAAMYYPEANVLVPAVADAESRTPAFKHILVTLDPQPSAKLVPLQVGGTALRH